MIRDDYAYEKFREKLKARISEMKFGDVCHSEANEVKPKNLVKVCKHS